MINCRNCINWIDESLTQIEASPAGVKHVFMGCRIFGYQENNTALAECAHFRESENLFALCGSCGIAVPKVCISLGECVNCTDTDLFCVDRCIGGENRKYCTHFVRLHTEGVHLISDDRAFDLFPSVGMPGEKKPEDTEGTAKAPSPQNE